MEYLLNKSSDLYEIWAQVSNFVQIWTFVEVMVDLLLSYFDLALTSPWLFFYIAKTSPWHCHDLILWFCLDIALSLPWPCFDLALTSPWPKSKLIWINVAWIKCCLDKCHHDGWNVLYMFPETYLWSFVKIGSAIAEIPDMDKWHRNSWNLF